MKRWRSLTQKLRRERTRDFELRWRRPGRCAPSSFSFRFVLPRLCLRAAFDQAAGVGGLIHQDQHIGGIAVFGFGGRNEAEVVRESHAGRQNLFQLENFLLIIEGEFITTPFGSFDDDLNEIFVFEITRGENAGVGKAFLGP